MASYIVLYHTESYSIIPLKSIISHIILWHRYRITVYIMANHIVLYHTESYSIIPLKANYITHHTLSYCGNDIVSHGIIPWHLYRTVSHRIIPYHTILYYWPVSEFRMKTNAADAERCTNRNSPCRRCQLHTHTTSWPVPERLPASARAVSLCTVRSWDFLIDRTAFECIRQTLRALDVATAVAVCDAMSVCR